MGPEAREERRREEAVGGSAGDVVDAVLPRNPPHVRNPPQPRERQTLVHEPVVAEDIRDAERRHPRPHPQRHVARYVVRRLKSPHDERSGDGGVEGRQRVVDLEPPLAPGVVRAVNDPERAVPHAPMEQRRPGFHRARRHEGDGDRDQRVHAVTGAGR